MTGQPVLDLRGALCPVPTIETARRLGQLAPGEGIRVLVTDPMAEVDIEALAARRGFEWLGCHAREDHLELRIRRPAER